MKNGRMNWLNFAKFVINFYQRYTQKKVSKIIRFNQNILNIFFLFSYSLLIIFANEYFNFTMHLYLINTNLRKKT